MAKLIWTEESLLWVKKIHDYIAQDNPDAADQVVDGILKKVELLEDCPEMGFRIDHTSQDEVRALLYGHYRIAYHINQDGTIYILGVFHGSIDIQQYL